MSRSRQEFGLLPYFAAHHSFAYIGRHSLTQDLIPIEAMGWMSGNPTIQNELVLDWEEKEAAWDSKTK